VAVIGASRNKEKVGYTVLDSIINGGYKGKVFPINPKTDEIFNRKCYKSILEVPQDIDLVIIVIPSKFVLQLLDQCAKKNVKTAVIITAGFKETGPEGAVLETKVAEKAREYGIRVIGPNCLGVIDTNCMLNATFFPTLPDRGSVSFISQSGALGTAALDKAKFVGLGISKFVSMGNKADVSENDLIQYMTDDDRCKVITAYLEGVKNGRKFMDICQKASKKKPVVIVKSGNTNAGARAVSSHTGTLAGSAKAYDAAFKQSGIIRAATIKDLFNYANTLANQPLPKGKKVAIITNAGGPGIMATDAFEENDISLAKLEKSTIDKLKKILPAAANFYNPVDVLGDALTDRYKSTLEIVLDDKNVDAVLILLTPQSMTESYETAEAIVEVFRDNNTRKVPIVTCFMGGLAVKEAIDYLNRNQIPNFEVPEEAVKSIKVMMDYYDWITKEATHSQKFAADVDKVKKIFEKCRNEGRLELGEMEARGILEAYNVMVPKAVVANDIAKAKEIAKEIGYPLVLKIVSPDILHKTDVGGIKVGINNEKELEDGFEDMLCNVKKYIPDADIKGISIQEMIESKKETIIGVSKDTQFGPMIMFGLGGIYVEVLKDVSFRIAPISREDAEEMIGEIKAINLLKGARGEKPSDINSIIEVLLKVSQLVTDFPEITEMDINPLFVKEEGKGAIAGDVRVVIGK
jgi:acetyltransferase